MRLPGPPLRRPSIGGPRSFSKASISAAGPAYIDGISPLPRSLRSKAAVALARSLVAVNERTRKRDVLPINVRKRPAGIHQCRTETPLPAVIKVGKKTSYGYMERAAKINHAAKTHRWLHAPCITCSKPLRWKCSRCDVALQCLSRALPVYSKSVCCRVCEDPPPLASRIGIADGLQLFEIRAKRLLRLLQDSQIGSTLSLRQSDAFGFVCACGWRAPVGAKRPWLIVDAHRAAHGLPPAVRPARRGTLYLEAAKAARFDLADRITAAWDERKPPFAHQLDGSTSIHITRNGSELKKFHCSKCDRGLIHTSARLLPCFAAAGFASDRDSAYRAAFRDMTLDLRERWRDLKAEHIHASRAAAEERAKARKRGPQVPLC